MAHEAQAAPAPKALRTSGFGLEVSGSCLEVSGDDLFFLVFLAFRRCCGVNLGVFR